MSAPLSINRIRKPSGTVGGMLPYYADGSPIVHDAISESLGENDIVISCGIHRGIFPLVGRSAGWIKQRLSAPFSISYWHEARIQGLRVPLSRIVEPGACLCFMRTVGYKGGEAAPDNLDVASFFDSHPTLKCLVPDVLALGLGTKESIETAIVRTWRTFEGYLGKPPQRLAELIQNVATEKLLIALEGSIHNQTESARVETVRPRSKTASQTTTSQTPPLVLGENRGNPIVRGRVKDPLTPARFDVVKALVDAGPAGLTKNGLDTKSGHTDARKILVGLRRSDPDWASIISMPGAPYGGYRLLFAEA